MSFQFRGEMQWILPHPLGGVSDDPLHYGAARIPPVMGTEPLQVIYSDGRDGEPGEGWEHVSVSLLNRTPTWAEMARIKTLFWGDDDCVVQFHPPKRDYVNRRPFCLHLWRYTKGDFPRPPKWLVG